MDDPELGEEAEAVASQIVEPSNFSTASSLPQWKEAEEYWKNNIQDLKVSKKYYKKLRRSKWRIFSHSIHYEGWQVVVFDRDKKKTIIVSNGGL